MTARVLIVAGSDSGGGAGIQADIKTVTALGGYAATAITALTAQDTTGVHGIHPVPPDFIASQMRVVLADIGADAVKTGMLGDAATIETVADVLAEVGARRAAGARSGDGGQGRRTPARRGRDRRAPDAAPAHGLCRHAQCAGSGGAAGSHRRHDRGHGGRGARSVGVRGEGGADQGRAHRGRHRDRRAGDAGGRRAVFGTAHRRAQHPRYRLHAGFRHCLRHRPGHGAD